MKKVILILTIVLFSFVLHAQDKIFVHTATAANINGQITYIDHPDLNGNPNAGIVFSHVWNPDGTAFGIYNNNIDGLWYNSGLGKWAIFNEDLSPMVEGASFFVYIASDPSQVVTHIASVANENPVSDAFTVLDTGVFGTGIGPYAVMSNYWNPNSVYNPFNYGFYYDDVFGTNRNIYNEAGVSIPTDAAFKILVDGTGIVTAFTHEATAANTAGNSTEIDNPSLNNNPNASFVFSHYYNVNGPSTQIDIDKKVSAWYDDLTGRWNLYTEDISNFPIGAAFDIIVADREILGTEDFNATINVSLYPNPTQDEATVTATAFIKNVSIYNLLGQKVKTIKVADSKNTIKVPVSDLQTGTYMVRVQTQNGNQQTIKLIKQ
jgi:hypothetical protein